ncbi:MAG TPA: protein kinase [Bacteroidota bacterium]|nr:protein kinase [Bacteroidota bacterium]
MIGQTISHYKILEKLGEGGMGVVYKAQDTKLDRIVALKFLPHHLTANEAEQARFLQEAKAAATLNHPHVCTIYRIDEFEGQQFIEMEYVEGETLRHRIPVKKLNDALGYAVQIGEALQEAHARGIVHRDVKCENIMVNTKNQIKVMDFGLAKLKGSLKLTRTSSTVGTLAYMAPEQIQGGEVDARSDIFSYGIVVFEMVTGKTPFRGEHDAAMMYSIVNEEPDAISKYVPDVSPELERIVRRSLEKDPDDRYQSVADMVSEIRRIQKQSTRVSRPVNRMDVPASPMAQERPSAESGSVPAASSRAMKNYVVGGIGIAVVLASVIAYFAFFRTAGAIDSLAVLPFVNAGSDPQLEYLSDGITESIINSLTRIRSLRVIPRSTVFRFKGKDLDPQDVGNKLNVGAVLSGKIVKNGDDLDVQVDLIDVKNQSQLWGDHYTRKLASVLSLQEDIVNDVSRELKISLTGETKRDVNKQYTQNSGAYQLYLQGQYYWNKRNAVSLDRAVDYFDQAIALDSTYALAYVGLADCFIIQPQYAGISTKISIPKARAAAQKALALDPSLAEAYTALAFCDYTLWKYEDAEREFKEAIELNPKYPTTYHWYGILVARMGDYNHYLTLVRQAIDLDPYSPVIALNMGAAYFGLENNDEALRYFRKSVELDPSFAVGYAWIAATEARVKDDSDALPNFRKAVELSGRSSECLGYLGHYDGVKKRTGEAKLILTELQDRYQAGTAAAYSVARVYAGMGDKESALDWLEKDYRDQSTWITSLLTDHAWDSIRSEPRFVDLEQKVGLVK